MDEDATNDDQVFRLVCRDHAVADGIGHSFGNSRLGRAKHLHGLFHSLDRHFGDHHGRWFNGDVGSQYGQQIGVTFTLVGQGVCKSNTHGAIFATDHEVDVCDFVAIAIKCFADVKLHSSFLQQAVIGTRRQGLVKRKYLLCFTVSPLSYIRTREVTRVAGRCKSPAVLFPATYGRIASSKTATEPSIVSLHATGNIIFVGATARAAAQSAARAGWNVFAIDLFGDRDLRAICRDWLPLSAKEGPTRLADQLAHLPAGPVVLLGGMESRLPDRSCLPATHPVVGASEFQSQQVCDPLWLDRLAGELAIARPARQRTPPADRRGWLFKQRRSSGGLGVFSATALASPPNDGWFERQVLGRSLGLNFLATADAVALLGVAASVRSRHAPRPFQYEGAIGLQEIAEDLRPQFETLGNRIAHQTGLRGLFGVDVIVDAQRSVWLLEINPRWTGSMELFDSGPVPLIQAHVAACTGQPISPMQPISPQPLSAGKRVFYAGSTIAPYRFDHLQARERLPAAVRIADVPADGTIIPAGQPVCSLIARGRDATQIARQLARACNRLRQPNWRPKSALAENEH